MKSRAENLPNLAKNQGLWKDLPKGKKEPNKTKEGRIPGGLKLNKVCV